MMIDRIETLLIGESPPMRRLRAQIVRFAPAHLPVLIQGPTGSGKELVAKALHVASGRSGAFVAFNVCALSDTMFEDAVFGHVKGAFTGATGDRLGYLAEANGGTVLLDEIGSMASGAQSKLLRAIDTGTFRAVGAAMDRVSDFRVLAATNEPLDVLVRHGRFRADLMHRLSGVVVDVPPLSDRPEDVMPLAQHFLRVFHGHRAGILTPDALKRLSDTPWPGHVRQLKHAIERAAILAENGRIECDHVDQSLSIDRAPADMWHDDRARHELLTALMETQWDTAAAAQLLGVHRATVYRRMRQLGLDARGVARPDIRTDSHSVARTRANLSEQPRLQ